MLWRLGSSFHPLSDLSRRPPFRAVITISLSSTSHPAALPKSALIVGMAACFNWMAARGDLNWDIEKKMSHRWWLTLLVGRELSDRAAVFWEMPIC